MPRNPAKRSIVEDARAESLVPAPRPSLHLVPADTREPQRPAQPDPPTSKGASRTGKPIRPVAYSRTPRSAIRPVDLAYLTLIGLLAALLWFGVALVRMGSGAGSTIPVPTTPPTSLPS